MIRIVWGFRRSRLPLPEYPIPRCMTGMCKIWFSCGYEDKYIGTLFVMCFTTD